VLTFLKATPFPTGQTVEVYREEHYSRKNQRRIYLTKNILNFLLTNKDKRIKFILSIVIID